MSKYQSKIVKGRKSQSPHFCANYMNSVRNKFQFLASQIINNVDVLLVSETKLDYSFPTAQLC